MQTDFSKEIHQSIMRIPLQGQRRNVRRLRRLLREQCNSTSLTSHLTITLFTDNTNTSLFTLQTHSHPKSDPLF